MFPAANEAEPVQVCASIASGAAKKHAAAANAIRDFTGFLEEAVE
jgi:hypothetical protein